MRKDIIYVGALWLVLAGCGGHFMQAAPIAGAPPHTAHPFVVQNGKIPVNWTQFKWGDTVQNPNVYNAITSVAGVMWYTDYNGNNLIKMTMGGSPHAFHLTCTCPTAGTLFYPASITVGADGKLYMGTASPAGYVGIATQTGAFSVKAIPSHDQTYVGGSARGPDNNVWFTELAHIAKISQAGTITEFKYPDGNTANYYGAVASGPGGDVWATEYNKNQIDDIDPDTGGITSYTLGCSPSGLIAASDGNLYAMCSSYLVRITPSGSFTLIYIPGFSDDGYPSALARGPDGNPWWTISGHNDIATYNPQSNAMSVYVPPTGFSTDYGLTAGPDGNVWALDSTGFADVYILNVLGFTPRNLTFTGIGQTIVITVTEPGTTSWTATSANPGVATVTQSSPASKFNVKSIGAGTSLITIKDAIGNSTSSIASVP